MKRMLKGSGPQGDAGCKQEAKRQTHEFTTGFTTGFTTDKSMEKLYGKTYGNLCKCLGEQTRRHVCGPPFPHCPFGTRFL